MINHNANQQRKQQETQRMIDKIRNQQEKLDELRDQTSRELHLDSDGDGITDIEERLKGTSPYSIDTDWVPMTDDKSGQPSTQPLVTPTDNPKYGCPLMPVNHWNPRLWLLNATTF